jgi:hypothetical protein
VLLPSQRLRAAASHLECRYYCVRGLLPNSIYELHVSNPGTVSVHWQFHIKKAETFLSPAAGNIQGRQLLDVERFLVATDHEGQIITEYGPEPESGVVVGITCVDFGAVPRNARPEIGVHFNLRFETLRIGFATQTVMNMVPVFGAAILIILVCALVLNRFFSLLAQAPPHDEVLLQTAGIEAATLIRSKAS